MPDDPYHVWKNRLRDNIFGIFDRKDNNTLTGESWEYPEFKGYYSGFYEVEVRTNEDPITILAASNDNHLYFVTPGSAKYSAQEKGVIGEVNPPFPDGNISFLHAISPIGTKFTRAGAEGPRSQKNVYSGETF